MKATPISSSISANLGNYGEAMVEFTSIRSNLWPPHFCTFCELVEGEENKLTTFSTWTIMLGCNESNTNFKQHLCKLGQLQRSNGRNSQVFGQAMKKRPTGHYKKYHTSRGETLHLTSSREGSGAHRTRAILSRDRTEDDETLCTALPIHLRVYTIYGET